MHSFQYRKIIFIFTIIPLFIFSTCNKTPKFEGTWEIKDAEGRMTDQLIGDRFTFNLNDSSFIKKGTEGAAPF
ncbi:MAG: hypothetical protein ABEH43_00465, partial [Flavobacteriales bacterium]